MVKIKGLFMIGTERKNRSGHIAILDNISCDLDDNVEMVGNVMYGKNGKHKLWLQIKLWIVMLLFRRDFYFIDSELKRRRHHAI